VRVVVLGGTRFIGRATVEELAAAGDELLLVHRGELEPDDLPHVDHLHCDRAGLARHRSELTSFRPDAVVDFRALSRADAEVALQALPDVKRRVVISSIDVYRAFGALNDSRETDPVPLDEESPVRAERYPYRGKVPDRDDYDKLDVEDVYLPSGATVLRLPMVYGEHDYQLRESSSFAACGRGVLESRLDPAAGWRAAFTCATWHARSGSRWRHLPRAA
jgi:UDP-glucose 4-epimerase